jgi:HEXXH motif-containing protein
VQPKPTLADGDTFAPSHERAIALDAAMRERLAASLGEIELALRPDEPAAADQIATASGVIRSGPVSSFAFAAYFDIGRAIVAGSAPGLHAGVVALVAALDRGLPRSRLLDLHDDHLGPGGAAAVVRVIDDDGADLAPGPVGAAAVGSSRTCLAAALALLAGADPALAGEIDIFGRSIILARSTRPGHNFGGAASPFLWGALVLDPDRSADRVALAEALAHESAHALLFGLAEGQPLTTNSRDERYGSPLRADPRPIEGIVHATFVLARMSHCLERLIGSGLLSADERAAAAEQIGLDRSRFIDGLTAVDAHAQLTHRGRAIVEAARNAMTGPEPARAPFLS